MNRLDSTFSALAAQGRKALVGFLTAGDPDADTSFAIIREACAAGLDVVELGVPFSDPTSDGPVIQRASQRALKTGASLSRTIELAARLRRETATPIVLFSYYNPVFKLGLQRTAEAAAAAGVDGMLVVDLPPEEAGPLAAALKPFDIHLIRLVAPTTTPERLRKLADGAGGFLYLVTRLGVTGVGGLDVEAVKRHAADVRASVSLPVCLGFGISSGDDAAAFAPLADGIIVGSAFVSLIEKNASTPEKLPAIVAEKVRELRAGCHRP
ncbi:MAG: tryptophan synthase subunit alpha [Kiritimatiellia bacterium]|jgi:tryptophan synthase alpha chain